MCQPKLAVPTMLPLLKAGQVTSKSPSFTPVRCYKFGKICEYFLCLCFKTYSYVFVFHDRGLVQSVEINYT